MADPIDISGAEAFAKIMTDVINSSNKSLLNEFNAGFREGLITEGRALIKEASSMGDFDDDDDDGGEKVVKAAKVISDQIAKAIGQTRIQKFEFDKQMGTAAISAMAQKIALPHGAAEKFEASLGARGFKIYIKKAEESIKKLVASGADMSEIMGSEENLNKLKLKILAETISQQRIKALSDKRIVTLQEALILATQQEVAAIERRTLLEERYARIQGTVSDKLSQIPLIGNALSQGFNKTAGNKSFQSSMVSKMPGFMAGGEATSAGGAIGQGAALAGFLALAAVIAMIAKRLMSLVGHQINFNSEAVKSVGISARMAENLHPIAKGVAQMAVDASLFGGDFNDALDAAREGAGGLVEEFGSMTDVNSENLKQVVGLSQRMGISAGQAAKMVAAWKLQLGLSGDSARELEGSLKASAEKYGLSFNQLLSDVAQNAGLLAMYVGRVPSKIAEAAANARRLGTSLESQARTAEQFETYEGAINNAFTVQFLTGEKMNAQQLYAQANYGDALSIQNKMVDAWQRAKKEQGLGIVQQKALLAAMGLTYDQANAIVERRKEEREITKSLSKIDKGLTTGENFEYNKRALRELQSGGQMEHSRSEVEERAAEIKSAEARAKSDIRNVTAALGLGELTSTTEKLQATMVSLLDRALGVLVGPIAQGIQGIAEIIIDLFGKKKTPEEMNEGELKSFLQSKGLAKYDERGNFAQVGGTHLNERATGDTDETKGLLEAAKRGYIPKAAIERLRMPQVNPFRATDKIPGAPETGKTEPYVIHNFVTLKVDGHELAKSNTKHSSWQSMDKSK